MFWAYQNGEIHPAGLNKMQKVMKAVDKIGRPPKRKSERRSYRVNVKLNTEEYYLLKGKARVSGMIV